MSIAETNAMDNLQTSILFEIGKAMSSSMTDKEKTHRLITEAVTMVLQVERSVLLLKDESGRLLKAEGGSGIVSDEFLEGLEIELGKGIMADVALKGESRLVCAIDGEDEVIKKVIDKFQVDSLITAPLKVEGKILGVITADTKRSGEAFVNSDLKLLSVLSNLAAVAEENAALIESLKDKASRLNALFEIGKALNSTLKLEDLLDLIIDKAIEVTSASSGSIMLSDAEQGVLVMRSSRGLSAEVMKNTRFKIGEGVTGWAAENGKALIVPDVTKDERYRSVNEKVKSELAVPMILEGEVIGVINVDHYELNAFTCWDMETLSTLASAAVVALRNAELFEKLETCSTSK
ncbi:MAG: GAF domain-containing protein [Deltaproteobacteria bacterium]|nr:GAF domain-containing protein [Deltaproteobacteria bacterium]